MRVLLIADGREPAADVRRELASEGLSVEVAGGAAEGLRLIGDGGYDTVVLDAGPLDCLDTLRSIRAAGNRSPVLVLTARDSVEERVSGLESGAADYLVKPFAVPELAARIRALGRRASQARPDNIVRVADVVLDTRRQRVWRGDRRVDLSPTEFALLDYLVRNRDRVLTRTVIAENVWRQRGEHYSNVIDVYVSYLRRKLDGRGELPRLIHTVRGVGYMLSEEGP